MQENRIFHGEIYKVKDYHIACDMMKECKRCTGLNCDAKKGKEATTVVFGSGNLDAKIVFIGQSACYQCMEFGIPFTGGSGDLLDECLQSIKLTRNDVFITNTCKCHPEGNRASNPDEIEKCRPYLQGELVLIKPKLIVTLGTDAIHWFFPDIELSKIVGKIIPTLEYGWLFPLYHPAFPWRRRDQIPAYKEQFSKIPEVLAKCP